MAIESALVAAWLTGRSLARGLPSPIPDRGGLRVDTGAEGEIGRWIFTAPSEAITAFTAAVRRSGHLVKLLAPQAVLRALLADGWHVESENCMMTRGRAANEPADLPSGYRWVERRAAGVTHLRILDAAGWLAASGYAAEVAGALVYDRILTVPGHRRRGLGRAMMAALGAARRDPQATDILTATAEGRALYESMGWHVVAPWSTASFAGGAAPSG